MHVFRGNSNIRYDQFAGVLSAGVEQHLGLRSGEGHSEIGLYLHGRRDVDSHHLGALELMILQTLRRGPLHGYAIAQHITETSDDLLRIEEGSLYPALQRMLKSNWVAAEWGVSQRNRRVRVYKITPAGRKQLDLETSDWTRRTAAMARLLKAES